MNRLGRALADPTRCRILLALLDGPEYPGRLAEKLELTRSNVSNHLTCLRGCGIVVGIPQGRQMRYEIADAHLAHALTDLLGVVLAVDTGEPCIDDERPLDDSCAVEDGIVLDGGLRISEGHAGSERWIDGERPDDREAVTP